jgi:hypothetical protein
MVTHGLPGSSVNTEILIKLALSAAVGDSHLGGHMSSAEDLRTKAARIADRRELGASSPPRKPVRSTVDLPAGQHARLRAWCGETAVELGRARVTTQDVLRALVDLLLADKTLALAIRDELEVR